MIFDEKYGNPTDTMKWETIETEPGIYHIVPITEINRSWEPMEPHIPSETCSCQPTTEYVDGAFILYHNVLN